MAAPTTHEFSGPQASTSTSYFREAHDFTIGNQFNSSTTNNITLITSSQPFDIVKELNPIANASYMRNLQKYPPDSQCLPGTRRKLINQIKAWAESGMLLKGIPSHVFWLYGYVGCGKSAIAQSVAEKFSKKGRLAASFFFFRGAGDRSRSGRFAATLASQLAVSIPAARPLIEIAHASLGDQLKHSTAALQFQYLFLEPFHTAFRSPGLKLQSLISGPYLTVIDGLDECEDRDDVASLVDKIVGFFKDKPRSPLRFFISSRVEEHIRTRLEDPESHVELMDVVANTNEEDIAFLVDETFKSAATHNRVIKSYGYWPSRGQREMLVRNADKSFIVITTMLKFVLEPTVDESTPKHRLALVLDRQLGLDGLYHTVLSRSKTLPHFHDIIATIALLNRPLSINQLTILLCIDLSHVISVLVNLHSIIHVPGDDDSPVSVFHSSLREFLRTERRAGPFFASPSHHKVLAYAYFKCGGSTSLSEHAFPNFDFHWKAYLSLHRNRLAQLRQELQDFVALLQSRETPAPLGLLPTYVLMDRLWMTTIRRRNSMACSLWELVARFAGVRVGTYGWSASRRTIDVVDELSKELVRLGDPNPLTVDTFPTIWDTAKSTSIPRISLCHTSLVTLCIQHLFVRYPTSDISTAKIALLPLRDQVRNHQNTQGREYVDDLDTYDYTFWSFGLHLTMAIKHDPNANFNFLTGNRTHTETSGPRMKMEPVDYLMRQFRYHDAGDDAPGDYLLAFRSHFADASAAIQRVLGPESLDSLVSNDSWGFTRTTGYHGHPDFWAYTCSKEDFSVLNLWVGYSLLAECWIARMEGTHDPTKNLNNGLDELYGEILSRSQDLSHFHTIISTVTLLRAALSTADMAHLLRIELWEVLGVLVNLYATVHVPGDDHSPVTLFHSSLREYLTQENRSGHFFVPTSFQKTLAYHCFENLYRCEKSTKLHLYVQNHYSHHWNEYLALHRTAGQGDFWVFGCVQEDLSILNLWVGYSMIAECYIASMDGSHNNDTCTLHVKWNEARRRSEGLA